MDEQAVELHNHEWDEICCELEWMGDETLALANKIWDEMDDDGATTMTVNLTGEERATVAGIQDEIRNAKPVGLEIEAGR